MSSIIVGFAVRLIRYQFIASIIRVQTQSKHTQIRGDQAGDRVADRAVTKHEDMCGDQNPEILYPTLL